MIRKSLPRRNRNGPNYQTGFVNLPVEPKKESLNINSDDLVKNTDTVPGEWLQKEKSKNSISEKRLQNKITEHRLFEMPYQKKIDDFYVYSDVKIEVNRIKSKEGTSTFETEVYQLVDPLTNKEISLIDRSRVSQTKKVGFGAIPTIYLIREHGVDGEESGKLTITEFDRNMNVLQESMVSDIPDQNVTNGEQLIPSETSQAENLAYLKEKLVIPSSKEIPQSTPEQLQREIEVRNAILNSNFHQTAGIISKYKLKQHDIRKLADALQVPNSSSEIVTINNIRDKLQEEHPTFADRSEETQDEMESLLNNEEE